MSDESRNPSIGIDQARLEIDPKMRDNISAIVEALRNIETILIDIDNRLKALE